MKIPWKSHENPMENQDLITFSSALCSATTAWPVAAELMQTMVLQRVVPNVACVAGAMGRSTWQLGFHRCFRRLHSEKERDLTIETWIFLSPSKYGKIK